MSKELKSCEKSWSLRLSVRQQRRSKNQQGLHSGQSPQIQELTAIVLLGSLGIAMLSMTYKN